MARWWWERQNYRNVDHTAATGMLRVASGKHHREPAAPDASLRK